MISLRTLSPLNAIRPHLNNKFVNIQGLAFSSNQGNNLEDIIAQKFDEFKSKDKSKRHGRPPPHSDCVIVGGGAVGLATAFFIKNACRDGSRVLVIEKDPTYSKSSTLTSRVGMKQQYGLKELVEMSKFSATFFRDIKEHLSVPGVAPPNILFNHEGFLTLATKKNKDLLQESLELQRSLGVQVESLNRYCLETRFPWMNFEDIEMGCYGMQDEGWFDPGLLLAAYKVKCTHLEVEFFEGEVVGASYMIAQPLGNKKTNISGVDVRTPSGEVFNIQCAFCINCAGPWSSEVAEAIGIGSAEEGPDSVKLPIEPRKRFFYMVHCHNGPGLNTPIVLDPSGVFLRREGLKGAYLCGANLTEEFMGREGSTEEVGREFFEKVVGPTIANRIPAFANLEVTNMWQGFYDFNYFDGSPIWGNHPQYRNFFVAAGFNGDGAQLSPAIGQSFLEYIIKGEYQTVDMDRFFIDRIYAQDRIIDPNLMLTMLA